MKRNVLYLVMVILLLVSTITAKTVTIYPGLNHVGIAKINKNKQYYQNLINLVNDNTISPVVSELTNRFIQASMYNLINASTSQEIKFTQQELQDIEDKYKSIDETLSGIDDPFKILVTMFISLSGADPSQYTSLISVVANYIKTKLSVGIEVAIENSKTNPDISQIKRTLAKATMDAIIVPLMEIKPVKDYFEQHTILKFVIENTSAILGDLFFEIYNKVKKGAESSQVIDEKIKLSTLEGIWSIVGAIDLWLKTATGFVKLLNLNSAIILTQNVDVKMSIVGYENTFINDFLFKYHSNLIEMYKVSDLGDQASAGTYFIDPANGINKTRPTTFYQLFVIYGITHGYLNNVDFNDPHNMYLMYTAAKQMQFFIKNYIGVNHNIYVDISDQDTAVTINQKTYQLQQLYWILPSELNNKIEDYMVNQSSYGNFYHLLFFENSSWNSFHLYNPFIASSKTDISLHKLPYYYNSISSQRHINITYDKAEIKEINGAGYLVFTNLQKTINWNGFLAEKGYDTYFQQYPKEIIQFDSVYIPFYRSNITDPYIRKLVDKYIHNGVLKSDIIDMQKYLTTPILSLELLESCSKEDHVQNIFIGDIDDAFFSIQWTTPIRRQQFFQFLVKVLKLDSNLYSYIYNNPLSNTSKCETVEGCMLKRLGILSGSNPDGILTMQQVLFTFENLEKYIERSKK